MPPITIPENVPRKYVLVNVAAAVVRLFTGAVDRIAVCKVKKAKPSPAPFNDLAIKNGAKEFVVAESKYPEIDRIAENINSVLWLNLYKMDTANN